MEKDKSWDLECLGIELANITAKKKLKGWNSL